MMFGLKWLTPEIIAAAGLTAATAGAAAPALAAAAGSAGAAGAAGAAGGAGALGAGTAGLLGAEAAAGAAAGTGLTLGGVSAAGGAAAPGLSLAGATGATGTGLTLGGVSAPAAGGLLNGASAFGSQAMGYLDTAGKAIKPIGQAANAAGAVSSMFPQSQPMQAPAPSFGNGAGSQAFNGLLRDQQATDQARMQEEMQRRQAQQKLIGLIGGM